MWITASLPRVTEPAHAVGCSPPNTSQQLAILREAGLARADTRMT
ncbi:MULTISPECIES: ArsR family transcriptional regulator [unclassified Streptomyces]